MDLGLEGKMVLVTGGSRGIGRATALAFACEGARVALVARERSALDDAAEAIEAQSGRRPFVHVCDCNQPHEVTMMARLDNVPGLR